MAIDWTDVVDIAPELSTVAVGMQNAILADINEELDPAVWGTRLDAGSKYLAAHRATLATRAGSGGAVQSETVGQVSRTYAVSSATAGAGYSATSYGQVFEQLMLSLAAARFTLST